MTELEILELSFQEWLTLYEVIATEHWDRLSVTERHILCKAQWEEFSRIHDDFKKKFNAPLSTRKNLET